MNGRGFQQSINELKKLFNSDATAAANQGRSGARCFVSTLPAHAVQATRSMCAAINSHQCARVRLRAARRGPDDRRDRHGLSPTTPPAAPAAARRSPATASTVGGTAWARRRPTSHTADNRRRRADLSFHRFSIGALPGETRAAIGAVSRQQISRTRESAPASARAIPCRVPRPAGSARRSGATAAPPARARSAISVMTPTADGRPRCVQSALQALPHRRARLGIDLHGPAQHTHREIGVRQPQQMAAVQSALAPAWTRPGGCRRRRVAAGPPPPGRRTGSAMARCASCRRSGRSASALSALS